jgi:predicted cobalt transporter CbtA
MFNRQELQALFGLLSRAPLSQAEALWVNGLFTRAQMELTLEEQQVQEAQEQQPAPAPTPAPEQEAMTEAPAEPDGEATL